MKLTRVVLVTFLVYVIQLGFLNLFAINEIIPDILLVLMIFVSLYSYDINNVILASYIIGLAKDIGSCAGLGGNALLFLILSIGIHNFKDIIFKNPLLNQIVITGIVSFVAILISGVYSLIFLCGLTFAVFIGKAVTLVIYTALVAPIFFRIYKIVLGVKTL